jgi:hypothetical protein
LYFTSLVNTVLQVALSSTSIHFKPSEMLFSTIALTASLAILASAQDIAAGSKTLIPSGGSSSSRLLLARDLEKRCTGSCSECFGSGYTLCPDSLIFCYLPGDSNYGLDSCSLDFGSSGSSGSLTSSATYSAPTSTSTGGLTGSGSSCSDQYGPGNIDCGSDACYNPDIGESCCAGGCMYPSLPLNPYSVPSRASIDARC